SPRVLSLHTPRDVHPFAAFLANESFDHAEAAEGVERPTMQTVGAANLRACEFHQSMAGAVDGNCIDHGAARIALDLHHIAVLHNYQATVAIRASGEFMRHDQEAAFVLHTR